MLTKTLLEKTQIYLAFCLLNRTFANEYEQDEGKGVPECGIQNKLAR